MFAWWNKKCFISPRAMGQIDAPLELVDQCLLIMDGSGTPEVK